MSWHPLLTLGMVQTALASGSHWSQRGARRGLQDMALGTASTGLLLPPLGRVPSQGTGGGACGCHCHSNAALFETFLSNVRSCFGFHLLLPG